jgi:universal stress protein A
MGYQHILLAIDFFEQTQTVVDKALALAKTFNAKLSLVHVVDSMPIPLSGYGLEPGFETDLTGEIMDNAKKKLTEFAKKMGISEDNLWVELGSPKTEITRIAVENQVDLVVVGSHGRHGLALLLGSTSTGVLHYAKCDVLAVRLKDN